MITATQADIDRFMKKVDKLPNGCWVWLGATSCGKDRKYSDGGRPRKKYGSFWIDGRTIRAHRFSCEVLKPNPTPLPPGHERGHTCHFSLCVCPDHVVYLPTTVNQAQRIQRLRERTPLPIELPELVVNHMTDSELSSSEG